MSLSIGFTGDRQKRGCQGRQEEKLLVAPGSGAGQGDLQREIDKKEASSGLKETKARIYHIITKEQSFCLHR